MESGPKYGENQWKIIFAGSRLTKDAYVCLFQDSVAWAMLTHWNTPKQDIGISPIEILYGWAIKDHFSILCEKYQVHRHWREMKELKEKTFAESKTI